MMDKKRIVFAFVEAGLGHIMPMRAIAAAFEKKYGEQVEVIKTDFFKDTGDPQMKSVEDELIAEVKLHNKHKSRGKTQFRLLRLFGPKLSMKYLMEGRYGRCFKQSLEYIKKLDADLIVNTHFASLYYSCAARAKGMSRAKVAAYCPDPVIGLQWDARADLIGMSSDIGKRKAKKSRYFRKTRVEDVPFLIRGEVQNYAFDRARYRRELGLPEDNFTVFLCDGAYGAGKIRQTVIELLKSPQKMTIAAVCGRNEELYKEFCALPVPEHITFAPYGFTDKTLALSASCDLFIGKAGASNLAEPAYFGAPAIVTFLATPIEKWISAHHEHSGRAVRVTNIPKAVALARSWLENPALMEPYAAQCRKLARCDGPEIYADLLWDMLQ